MIFVASGCTLKYIHGVTHPTTYNLEDSLSNGEFDRRL
jgi:hypothetical protein